VWQTEQKHSSLLDWGISPGIDSTIEQDNHCVKSMWGENHAHECFATLQIWLLVP
jgi:hypothetical protein